MGFFIPMSHTKKETLLSWSGGKDAAWALKVPKESEDLHPVRLFSTFNPDDGKIAVHGTPIDLIEAQARAVGLPLDLLPIPNPCPNDLYATTLRRYWQEQEEAACVAFGDLFLEDIRKFREDLLKETDLVPVFPLWNEPTDALARRMIEEGTRAVVTCVDTEQLPGSFMGRAFDGSFLNDLPESADPCGEGGEFHTFVFDHPTFREPVCWKDTGRSSTGRFHVLDITAP